MKKNVFLYLVFIMISTCLVCSRAQAQQKKSADIKLPSKMIDQQKILTDAEVEKLVQEMIKKLTPQISLGEKEFVNTAITKSGENSVALSNMAVAAWYTGHPKAALMTALKAAALPHPDAAFNNVAAILNLSGYQEKAVPLLRNLLSKYPENSTVLNNLGQAYYELGDEQNAKTCLLQCIKRSPNHPEACNTMAMMFLKAGRTAEAIDYLEQSLKGAYNASARNTLEEQKPDYDFIPIEEAHFSRPADLPDLDIQMPPLPYDVYTVADVHHKHDIFKRKIEAICNDLDNKISAEQEKEPAEILTQEKAGKSAPFTGPGTEMFGHFMAFYEGMMLEKKIQEGNIQADINAKYEPILNAIMKDNTGNYCKKLNEVRSKKQNELSSQYKEYMENILEIARQYLDKSLQVLPLMAVCKSCYNAEYYRMLRTYIWKYYALSQSTLFETNCEGNGKINPYDYNPDLNLNPTCRYKVVIPFIIGSMKFDCSTFEFEGGELLKLGIKRDFITNQTTLAIGAGVGIETPITEIGAQQSFYISFDSDQQPTDIGMKGEVKSTVGAGVTSESGVEYTMGMNSGIDVSVTEAGRSFKL
jgi:tetratricopeptide (TPR) repeat protein